MWPRRGWGWCLPSRSALPDAPGQDAASSPSSASHDPAWNVEEGSLAVGEQGGRGATDLVPGLYSLGDPSKASLALIFFGGGGPCIHYSGLLLLVPVLGSCFGGLLELDCKLDSPCYVILRSKIIIA